MCVRSWRGWEGRMPDGLYERDILAWSEEQARLLQRIADGEAGVNAVVDWPNLIEEVQDVGLSQLKACQSLLRQALVHLLKLHAWPGSQSAEHWQDEAEAFLADARDRFSPSMRQKLNVTELYEDALHRVSSKSDRSGKARPASDACPFTLDDLLQRRPDMQALVARLGGADA